MTDHRLEQDDGLDVFFDAARDSTPALSEAALARMTSQALAIQTELTAPAPAARRRPGVFVAMLAAIGGWPAMAGLATAGVAGLWIGAMPPVALVNLAVDMGAVTNTAEDDSYLVDPLPGYGFTLEMAEAQ